MGTIPDKFEKFLERMRFSPELRNPKPIMQIPKGKGTYVKLLSCTPFKDVSDPYFSCFSRDPRLVSQKKSTNVGLQSRTPVTRNYFWDYIPKHPKMSGYGLWFPRDTSRCVRCYLKDRRLGIDRTVGKSFEVCGSANKSLVWKTVRIRDGGRRESCRVAFRNRM